MKAPTIQNATTFACSIVISSLPWASKPVAHRHDGIWPATQLELQAVVAATVPVVYMQYEGSAVSAQALAWEHLPLRHSAASHELPDDVQLQHVGLQSCTPWQAAPSGFVPVSPKGLIGHCPLTCSPA